MDNDKDARIGGLTTIQMILQSPSAPTLFDNYIPNIHDFGGSEVEDFTVFLLEIELFFIALAIPDTTRYTILRIMLKDDAKAFLERWEKEQQSDTATKGSRHDYVSTTCITPIEGNQCCFPCYQAAISALEHQYVKSCELQYYKYLKEQLYHYSIYMIQEHEWYVAQASMFITKQPA